MTFFNFYKYSKYQNELPKSPNLIGQKTEEIIPIGINNQSQQQEKPYHLGILHKLVIRDDRDTSRAHRELSPKFDALSGISVF